jgi:hypothetical protein
MRSKRIEISPKPIRLDGNIASRATPRPFEHSMFDEMADAVKFGRFVAGTTSHPNPGSY